MNKMKSRDNQQSKSDPSENVMITNDLNDTQCSNRNNKGTSTKEDESFDQLMIDVEDGIASKGTTVRWKEMLAYKMEFYIKLIYPILFFLFNIVYWIHYA